MAVNNLSDVSRAMFQWWYPFGAVISFILFFVFVGTVWIGYMVYMSRCKSRMSGRPANQGIYQADESAKEQQGETTA